MTTPRMFHLCCQVARVTARRPRWKVEGANGKRGTRRKRRDLVNAKKVRRSSFCLVQIAQSIFDLQPTSAPDFLGYFFSNSVLSEKSVPIIANGKYSLQKLYIPITTKRASCILANQATFSFHLPETCVPCSEYSVFSQFCLKLPSVIRILVRW